MTEGIMWTRSKINQYKDKAKLYFFAAIFIDDSNEPQNSTDSIGMDVKVMDFVRIKQRISTLPQMADSLDNFSILLLARACHLDHRVQRPRG
ncbi:hypothetical protein WH50_04785 [Pokkaliibacter plantistimulans]|uniref:Uncharacterized protein n=1 Tax=Pokkaliibacter plantistimulans TaxID=1635171 RepID=A0ABX5M0L7_9GAMM|nr:hypothetical protein WH50_04785 [Pokkaliibacter plantistimulans]